jgi:hypothetical protein
VRAALLAPGEQLVDRLLRGDQQAADAADVAGVGDQGAVNQRVEAELATPARTGVGIAGEAPAGVEGEAPGVDFYAAQQRLEAGERVSTCTASTWLNNCSMEASRRTRSASSRAWRSAAEARRSPATTSGWGL